MQQTLSNYQRYNRTESGTLRRWRCAHNGPAGPANPPPTPRCLSHTCQELDTFFGSAANPESNTKRQLPHSGQLLDAAASTLNNLNRPGMGGISFAADGYQRHQAGHLEQHDVCVDSRPAGYQAQQQQQQEQQHQHTGAQLTHIDSAGSASMVDVSQVG